MFGSHSLGHATAKKERKWTGKRRKYILANHGSLWHRKGQNLPSTRVVLTKCQDDLVGARGSMLRGHFKLTSDHLCPPELGRMFRAWYERRAGNVGRDFCCIAVAGIFTLCNPTHCAAASLLGNQSSSYDDGWERDNIFRMKFRESAFPPLLLTEEVHSGCLYYTRAPGVKICQVFWGLST